jgi:hypothetical protein
MDFEGGGDNPPSSCLHLMFKFLLIFPTPVLEKKFDPRKTPSIPAVNFFSALDLNKFSKNLKIKLQNIFVKLFKRLAPGRAAGGANVK